MTRRRRLQQALALAASGGAWPLAAPAQPAQPADGAGERKVLRVLFRSAETGFDPARLSDLYSRTVTGHIFESLYAYDPLARPTRVVPLTAVGMPEVSGDYRVWTVRVQPGIFFADDPAFGGRRREMVAQDHVYAFQRAVDPANLSPFAPLVLDLKIIGLAASRDAAKGGAYDYDKPIEGLQVLDRHTLRFTLEEPRPRFVEALAQSDLLGAQAREVVQHYGAAIGEHPVGTGPFRLKSWRRSSRIVLERNPGYREVLYHGQPAPDDAEGQALLARFKGRRLPMVDEVDVAIVEESQPQWLSFLNGQVDGLVTATGALPNTFVNEALPGGHLSPRLARAQVQAQRVLASDSAYTVFGMNDPIVGGNAPAQVALRRAISLAFDVGREIRLLRRNQAVPAQSFMLPHTSGYDPAFKSEMSDYDPARAKALLDVFGYRDRDGDGFRERPDGSPLELVMATEPDTINRAYNELWQKCMNAVGLRIRFATQQWAENLKAAEAGKLMMWQLGGTAASPDGQDSMAQMYSPQAGGQNLARFKLDAMDRLYERTQTLPDGPERDQLFFEAKRLAVAYMPYKAHVHRVYTDLCHPWLTGFRRPLFAVDWWQRVDIDPALRRRMTTPPSPKPGQRARLRLAALLALEPLLPLSARAAATATHDDPADAASGARKVLNLAFTRAETSFDPARIVDLYSRVVTAHIFEAPYGYDHLARPAKFVPLTAVGMPEHSDDFRVWTVRIKPGIYFADDPAFKGRRRELVAEDYIYQLKRVVDPKNKSPIVATILDTRYVGLNALRDDAIKHNKPLDYDRPIEGLKALDRYTIRYTLEQPRPLFIDNLAASDLLGAVAREVVEAYGDQIDAHPVGTGPFRLKSWRRSSEIVLERNPGYRERFYDAEPAADDAEGQAILARFKGRRLPMVDEVRVSIIEQSQPMWLAFLNGQVDALATNAGRVPPDYLGLAMPGGHLAPFLARRGIQGKRSLNPDTGLAYFNMEDPLVGGYTPEKVALRRAISLGYDVDVEIRQIRRGGLRAQSPVVPHTMGYDPAFKSEMSDHDPARARALLDLYGYVDRDGDGWREQPDGRPLAIEMASQPDDQSRKFDELWKRCMSAIGIRIVFKPAQWPENLKAARAGRIQFWQLGSSAAGPDGQDALARLYGPQSGSQNLARFKLAAFDAIYQRMRVIPPGPERDRLFFEAKRLAAAYMPYRHTAHRMEADLLHPWVVGYRRPLFWQDWWHMVDIDVSKRAQRN